MENFYSQCSPNRENLCLYGLSDGSWEVTLPCEEVPPELPEPALGINFARDGMRRSDWLALVAVHSDSWLMAVAFYNGARLDQEGRRQLFNDINSLPTCFEIVSGRVKASRLAAQAGPQIPKATLVRNVNQKRKYDEDGGGDYQNNSTNEYCPNCGKKYKTGEFWIACDFCDRWFDGKCVDMTQQKADRQPHWRCPMCVRKGHGGS